MFQAQPKIAANLDVWPLPTTVCFGLTLPYLIQLKVTTLEELLNIDCLEKN